MKGTLYGVGVGPGDPELMTLKAVNIIGKCRYIGIPASEAESCTAYLIAKEAVPELDKKEIIAVEIPMISDIKALENSYEKGCKKLIDILENDCDIAFLNLGDPTIYGSYMTLHELVGAAGYKTELVSGVSSFSAVAAKLGMRLGKRKEVIHIIPGHYSADEQLEKKIREYLGNGDTLVIMKSSKDVGEIKRVLVAVESEGLGHAGYVTNCGMPGECIGDDIRDLDENAGYFTTIIVEASATPCYNQS